jgi:hypothetical protein
MSNLPTEQSHSVDRNDAEDKPADDIPNSDTRSATSHRVAPILRCEDDGLHDEDAPEQDARRETGSAPAQAVSG